MAVEKSPSKLSRRHLKATDFSRSFATWLVDDQESFGRFCIDSVVSGLPDDGGRFFLLASVLAGNVYGQGDLPKMPPYEFTAIFSEEHFRILRTGSDLEAWPATVASIASRFRQFSARLVESASDPLDSDQDVADAVFANRPIVAVARIPDIRAKLHFPVKHINVQTSNTRFQVETGPVLVPSVTHSRLSIEGLEQAFAFFNSRGSIQLLVRSTEPGAGALRRTYSRLEKHAAQIRLFAL